MAFEKKKTFNKHFLMKVCVYLKDMKMYIRGLFKSRIVIYIRFKFQTLEHFMHLC